MLPIVLEMEEYATQLDSLIDTLKDTVKQGRSLSVLLPLVNSLTDKDITGLCRRVRPGWSKQGALTKRLKRARERIEAGADKLANEGDPLLMLLASNMQTGLAFIPSR
jgi:hypothetical protein